MRETKEFVVDGVSYKLTQFGAKKAQATLLSVAKVVGGAIGQAGVEGAGDVQLASILEQFFEKVSQELLDKVCADFAELCLYQDGEKEIPLKPHYDNHFAGRTMAWMGWLSECFEANYGDFLSELRARGGVKFTNKAVAPQSQSTSTGSSTG